ADQVREEAGLRGGAPARASERLFLGGGRSLVVALASLRCPWRWRARLPALGVSFPAPGVACPAACLALGFTPDAVFPVPVPVSVPGHGVGRAAHRIVMGVPRNRRADCKPTDRPGRSG